MRCQLRQLPLAWLASLQGPLSSLRLPPQALLALLVLALLVSSPLPARAVESGVAARAVESGVAARAVESGVAAESPIAECVPKPTLPLPSCVPAENWGEHAELTLLRAEAWVQTERFKEAERILGAIDERDLGLFVRAQALLGRARRGLAQWKVAEGAFEAASTAWKNGGLAWIRSLPGDDVGERAVRLAANAAAFSALQRAELRARKAVVPLRAFEAVGAAAVAPFYPRPDAALTSAEHAERKAWSARRREAFVRYSRTELGPWMVRQRAAILEAQRDFLAVHLVPPAVLPEWRIAVAANIGVLWGDFLKRQRTAAASCGEACDSEWGSYYGTFDDPWEPYKQLARRAFEVCVSLSREHRVLSDYTLICERWLAQQYRFDHQGLDELFPTPHWVEASDWVETPLRFALPRSANGAAERALRQPGGR